MKPSVWTGLGWVGIGLAIAALPAVMLDPVLAGFALYLAIIVGGLSSIGVRSTVKFAVTTIMLSLLVANVVSNYSPATGFRTPSVSSVLDTAAILGPLLIVSIGLIIWGVARRAVKKILTVVQTERTQ